MVRPRALAVLRLITDSNCRGLRDRKKWQGLPSQPPSWRTERALVAGEGRDDLGQVSVALGLIRRFGLHQNMSRINRPSSGYGRSPHEVVDGHFLRLLAIDRLASSVPAAWTTLRLIRKSHGAEHDSDSTPATGERQREPRRRRRPDETTARPAGALMMPPRCRRPRRSSCRCFRRASARPAASHSKSYLVELPWPSRRRWCFSSMSTNRMCRGLLPVRMRMGYPQRGGVPAMSPVAPAG